jgi:lysophospholipase L1-like esterase
MGIRRIGSDLIGPDAAVNNAWIVMAGTNLVAEANGKATRIGLFTPADTPAENSCKVGIYNDLAVGSAVLYQVEFVNAIPGQINYMPCTIDIVQGNTYVPTQAQNGTHGIQFTGATGVYYSPGSNEAGYNYATEIKATLRGYTSGAATICLFLEYDDNPATEHSLNITNDGNGVTEPSGSSTINDNTDTPIAATPTTGYVFSNWTVISGSATFTNANSASTTVSITADTVIRANFVLIQNYDLTVSNDGNGTTNPSGVQSVQSGAITNIAADPATGYGFVNWTVVDGLATIDNDLLSNTSVVITGDATIQANYALLTDKAMPVGDSISYGFPDPALGGYRKPLQDLTEGAFDFVGEYNDPITGEGYDGDHAGHVGDTIAQIAARLSNNLTTYFINCTNRSVVLLLAGTNDIYGDDNREHYPALITAYEQTLVDAIVAHNPNTRVLCGLLPPIQNGYQNGNAVFFNGLLATMLQAKAATNPNIVMVDLYSAITANTNWSVEWMYDNLHLTPTGYAAMAQAWYDAIVGDINEVSISATRPLYSISSNVLQINDVVMAITRPLYSVEASVNVITPINNGAITITRPLYSVDITSDLVRVLTSIVITPSSAKIAFGKTKQFSAIARDQTGAPLAIQPEITWSIDAGSIDQTGLFTAGNVVETITITATIGGISRTASVSVLERLQSSNSFGSSLNFGFTFN